MRLSALEQALLVKEAKASTQLDRDPYEGTQSLPSTMDDEQGDSLMSEFDYETADAAQAEVETNTGASAAEARAWLLANADQLPEGVKVGARGRLSESARKAFTEATGREIQ